jgi:hypothetical protein
MPSWHVNRIKEQLMLFADRTSTAWMRSNQLRLYFSSIAYLLLEALRRLRTDEEIIEELIPELGFSRRGPRIEATIRSALDVMRASRDRARPA